MHPLSNFAPTFSFRKSSCSFGEQFGPSARLILARIRKIKESSRLGNRHIVHVMNNRAHPANRTLEVLSEKPPTGLVDTPKARYTLLQYWFSTKTTVKHLPVESMPNKYIRKAVRGVSQLIAGILPKNASLMLLADLSKNVGVRTVTVGGNLGRIEGFPDDLVLGGYLQNGDYQPQLRKLIDNCLGPEGGVFLDIGANIGLTTISAARRADVLCHAFEPEPGNFRLLENNIRENAPDGRTTLHNLALFKDRREVEFELSEDTRGDHRIRQDSLIRNEKFQEAHRKTVSVQADRLDDVFDPEGIQGHLVLKVDTQGGEVNVFPGATKVLERADFVISEFCPYMLLRAGTSVEKFISIIKRFPFAAVLLDGNEDQVTLKPVDEVVAELSARVPFDGSAARHMDLILARHEPVIGANSPAL